MIPFFLNNLDIPTAIGSMIIISFFLRLILQLTGQSWITTTAHTATLFLLPITTFVITKVIAGNIALSLGMVGALSIVRFRNPVRSPLELSVYFISITMGIAASVGLRWLFLLIGAILCVAVFLTLLQYFSVKFLNTDFFTTSFSEGNSLSSLEITANKEIKVLEESNFLNFKKSNGEDIYYVLSATKFTDLNNILKIVNKDKEILNYQIRR